MSIDEYISALEARLREIGSIVTATTLQREIDANLGIGFIKGYVTLPLPQAHTTRG
jgi:hypothetical protein